jgi:hypothetical protein
MKNEGFPWTNVGSGPEPRLPPDFASRVIEIAHTTRARKRRAKIGLVVSAGFAALLATFLWMHSAPSDQQTLAQASRAIALSRTIAGVEIDSWDYQPNADPATVLMPAARQAEKFDAYYGSAAWDSYASWNPNAYDSLRTR